MFLCEKLNIPTMPDFKPLGGVNKVARQHILKERNEVQNIKNINL